MLSMTGYGYARRYTKYGNFEVEIISLNSREVEITLSGNRDIIGLEREIRKIIKKYLKRGKIKIKFYFPPPEDYVVDERKLKRLIDSIKKFEKREKLNIYFDNADILREIFIKKENLEKKKKIFLKILEIAVKRLLKFRKEEGENLKKALLEEVKKLENLLNNLNDEKCKEEKIRILSHVESIIKTINSKGSWGKKIDFLGQEILREGNTISQKSENLENINIAIEIKLCAENIREIARNIE
ncbi:MAG: DUF1732 domain-containing protein [candidate division WOR-3 bacterium]